MLTADAEDKNLEKRFKSITMMSLFIIKCLACWISLLHCSYAFVVAPHPTNAFVASSLSSLSPKIASKIVPRNKSVQLDMVFGNKKTKGQKELEDVNSKYWQGEWVCKDCGYIYNRAECAGMYFEEQGPGFRCPQCSGPRRRYAKKVGDVVGTTLDGGDAPILLFSFGGVLATIIFGFWAANNL